MSQLTGIAHLRGHETDRLAALSTEINGLGGQCEETPDGLVITAQPLHGGLWRSYADHRMATAGAIVGLRVTGVEVEDIGTTAKTLPEFPQMWAGMLAGADARQEIEPAGLRRVRRPDQAGSGLAPADQDSPRPRRRPGGHGGDGRSRAMGLCARTATPTAG